MRISHFGRYPSFADTVAVRSSGALGSQFEQPATLIEAAIAGDVFSLMAATEESRAAMVRSFCKAVVEGDLEALNGFLLMRPIYNIADKDGTPLIERALEYASSQKNTEVQEILRNAIDKVKAS